MRKKLLAVLLTLVMVVSLAPPIAFAEGDSVSQEQSFEEGGSSNDNGESSSETSDTEQSGGDSDQNVGEGEETSSSENSSSENPVGGVDNSSSEENNSSNNSTENSENSQNDNQEGKDSTADQDKNSGAETGSAETPSAPSDKTQSVTEETDSNGLPKEEKNLTDILGTDENGNPKMYTTLYDSQKRIVSTNDPDEEQDDYYKNGGTVGLNDVLYVHFNMAEIIPNDGENGLQENVTYVLSNLPNEFLVPAEQDMDGRNILNPETPVEFFRTSGDIQSYGGIYGTKNNCVLKVFFKNVEENIDISGVFHYGATVNDGLIPGENYVIDNVPGGSVSFTVTPNKNTPSAEGYNFILSGSSGGPTSYYWCTNIEKTEDETSSDKNSEENGDGFDENTVFPYNTLKISTDDAMGVWVNENNFSIFNAYGDGTGPFLTAYITYTTKDENDKDKDGNPKNKSESIRATEGNIIQNSNGITTVRLKGTKEDLQIDLQFRKEDAVEDTCSQYNGKYSYITNTVHATITSSDGSAAKNIKRITLYVPTISYDDYEHMGSFGYTGTAELSYDGENTLSSTGSITANYYTLSTPYLTENTQNPSNSYEFLSESIYTNLNSNSSNYSGNYYWVDFKPSVENSGDANYYVSNSSFLPGNSLISTNGKQATFSQKYSRDSILNGMVSSNDWQFIGTVSVAQVIGDNNLIANSCFASGGNTGGKITVSA